jgi:endonuclease/exonuclease/phosphatase family metal-dependent hydrolase
VYQRILRVAAVLGLVIGSAASATGATLTWIDTPRASAQVVQPFSLGGWSIDLAATRSAGVAAVHVWAFPASGAAPVWVGAMSPVARADVAAAFGSQHLQSGFNLDVSGLTPGSYTFVLFPYSTVLGQFDFARAYAIPLKIASTSGGSSSTMRLLQWNTHHGGYGTDGVYSPDRIATWAASMQPDVIMFNEIEKYTSWGNQDQPEVYKSLLQQKTGKTWYYVFAQEFGNWSSNGKGNLILSTYPINSSNRYELVQNADRSIAEAEITVNGRNISLILTHLDPYDQALRLAQATEVTAWSVSQPENRIVTGDMNAWPDQTSIAQFNKTYYDSWSVAASYGSATAFSGNDGQTKNGRIDYIFYSRSSSNLTVQSSQVYDTRDSSGNMPSDHRPVLTTFVVR